MHSIIHTHTIGFLVVTRCHGYIFPSCFGFFEGVLVYTRWLFVSLVHLQHHFCSSGNNPWFYSEE